MRVNTVYTRGKDNTITGGNITIAQSFSSFNPEELNAMEEILKNQIGSGISCEFDLYDEMLRGREEKTEQEKPFWIKIKPNQKQGRYFMCSGCKRWSYCISLDENKENHCDYKFCPHCGREMEGER